MTYEYICTACNHEWEASQSISDAPLKTCPKCGKDTARRQISGGTGFVLKGGGWYADGYASASPKSSSASSESSGGSGSSSKSSSSGDKASSATKDKPKASSAAAADD